MRAFLLLSLIIAYAAAGDNENICNILDHGAKPDNATNNAVPIARAIASCRSTYGPGEPFVLLFPGAAASSPPAVYMSGSFNLTSDMTLRLGANAVLFGSPDPADYPLVDVLPSFGQGRDGRAKDLTRRYGALVSGWNVSNVIIEGSGMGDQQNDANAVLDGNGAPWWARYFANDLAYSRPRLIELLYSNNLIVRDLRIRNPPFWNTHFVYSRDILVENVQIRAPFSGAPNADGLDLDSVTNATVRFCDIAVGDDAIAIKSGLNQPGIDYNWPSTHIHIHDVWARSKCIAIGSEMSGGVHDVLVENVVMGDARADNSWHALYVKTRVERGGTVSGVVFRNISTAPGAARETSTAFINVDMDYGNGGASGSSHPSLLPPVFQNFTFEDITVANTNAVGLFRGLPGSNVGDVTVRNLRASNYTTGLTCDYAFRVDTGGFADGDCLRAGAGGANSTASWEAKRAALIDAVFGYGPGVLPAQSEPNATRTWPGAPEMVGLVWDLTTTFPITSTVFYAKVNGPSGRPSKTAFLFHHGHSNCACERIPEDACGQYKCAPGCYSTMTNGTGFNWWDLYNVTSFFHALGHDVFILSMPLKGINLGPGSTADHCNTGHWWFEQWEQKGEHALRYFVEPIVLTGNYALNVVGYDGIYMAGLSGGGWSTTFGPAVDKRIARSFPIAGSTPCGMRDPYARSWPWGNDAEDFEQNCGPNPGVGAHASLPGRRAFQACNYTCMYVLGGLEPGRFQTQILHEYDSCCFATHDRHDKMLRYEANVRAELASAGAGARGWFTVAADNHTKHEVCPEDKHIIAAAMAGGDAGWKPGDAGWDHLPCDIIHGPEPEGYTCPEPHPPMQRVEATAEELIAGEAMMK